MVFDRNLLLLVQCALVASQVHLKDESPQVKLTEAASISGTVKLSRGGRSFAAFTGIPYATIAERFAEPKLLAEPDWEGESEFTTAGAMCPQVFFTEDHDMFDDEDCLNLNVYVPLSQSENAEKKYPVMMWIHGGAFTFGGGYGYGPLYLMDENVILVTINYRLGVFGFLSTGDEVVPGNNGLKDMVAALKWIQKYITKFGGDPDRVTIFGESAGGGAVHHLLMSPATKGLFHRAISQSGAALCSWAHQPNPKVNAVDIAKYLNCSDTSSSEQILACLKDASKDELNLAQFSYQTIWPSGFPPMAFGPTAEPEQSSTSTHTPFATKSPFSILANGEIGGNGKIPWMLGITEDEGASMANAVALSDPDLFGGMDSNFSTHGLSMIMAERHMRNDKKRQVEVIEKLRKNYFGDKKISLETAKEYVDFNSDGLINHGVYQAAKQSQRPVYLYQYAYKGPVSLGGLFVPLREEEKACKKIENYTVNVTEINFVDFYDLETFLFLLFHLVVGHGDELQHLFDMDDSVAPGMNDAVKTQSFSNDVEFSRNLVRLWVSFAEHG